MRAAWVRESGRAEEEKAQAISVFALTRSLLAACCGSWIKQYHHQLLVDQATSSAAARESAARSAWISYVRAPHRLSYLLVSLNELDCMELRQTSSHHITIKEGMLSWTGVQRPHRKGWLSTDKWKKRFFVVGRRSLYVFRHARVRLPGRRAHTHTHGPID